MIKQYVNNFISRCKENNPRIEAIALANKEELLIEHHFTWVDTRNIYSHTKSVISIAVGIAVKEGIISLDDKLVEVLSKYLPENYDPNLSKITLRHLLMMASGFNQAYLMQSTNGVEYAEPDYLKFMLSLKVEVEPGTRFVYSNGDTYLVARMLEEKLGYPLQLYLYNKIFKPLNMGNPVIYTDLQGRVFGASGLHLSIDNQIKLGQFLLNGNEIDEKYFYEMGRTQIVLEDGNKYGYQFWVMNDERNWYMMSGAYGQITYVLTDLGYVISIQCPDGKEPTEVGKLLNEEIFNKI